MYLFLGICVSVSMYLTTCSSKVVFHVLGGKTCMEKSQISFLHTLGESKFRYLYILYIWSVSSVRVEAKSHQLPILVILIVFLVLSTKNLYRYGDS